LRIDPSLVQSPDVDMLQDLVLAAVNEGIRTARRMIEEEMGKLTGGVGVKLPRVGWPMAPTPSMTPPVEQLPRAPGIGERTAGRLAFHILRADRQYAQDLADALVAVKDETRLCSVCFALTETDPCPICTDPGRVADAICVVEEPADLLAVERAREFRGRYHVLHGTLAPLAGIGPAERTNQ